MSQRRIVLWIFPCLVTVLFGLWGIDWGLPSIERRDLFLDSSLRTPEFYQRIEKARDEMYSRIDGNIAAHFGRTGSVSQVNPYVTLLSSYSSYLVKTHAMDEAATMVMLSRINPLKNRWYPHSFVYGGAYLYPLGFFLATGQLLQQVDLVSSVSYYYAHPEKMAQIYTWCRLFSLLGILVASFAVFRIGSRLWTPQAGQWAALFFGLAPTCLAHAKFAKPHTWAAALTLWGIHFALESKVSAHAIRNLLVASVCLGLAMGMTVTQVVFVPFLLWASWSADRRETLRRSVMAMCAVGVTFLATNFYLFTHWREYLDEQAFLRQYSPFAFNLKAALEFFTQILRWSLGWELWGLVLVGWVWALVMRKPANLRPVAVYLVFVSLYVAFQTQAQSGLALTSRLFLAMIGLLCVLASGATFTWPRFGRALRWALFSILLVKAGYYSAHFRSDRAPFDNASLASLWIDENIPHGSMIAQSQLVPHVDFFPPIDFAKYTIVRLDDPRLQSTKVKLYAVIAGKETEAREILSSQGFVLKKAFRDSPLQKLGFRDAFSNANFPIEIYIRNVPKSTSRS